VGLGEGLERRGVGFAIKDVYGYLDPVQRYGIGAYGVDGAISRTNA
jgi:hypothetical protein